jgi:hypothetical protein
MNARAIPRSAVQTYLKLVRLPLDRAISLLPGNGTGAKPAARLALDRFDATLRAALASMLSDPVLHEDAEQRRAAAEQREYGLRLRVEAEGKAEQADARLEARQQRTTQQRERANQQSRARRQDAARAKEQDERRAAKAARERLDVSRRTAKHGEEVLNHRAAKERLETLSSKTDALRAMEKELTARDEARRLREAASRTKAERKAG